MTAEQKLAYLASIASKRPRSSLRKALRELSDREAVYTTTQRLRAEIALRQAAVRQITTAGMTEGLIYG